MLFSDIVIAKLFIMLGSFLIRSELWDFYGKRFGKLSEMPYSDYKFITASKLSKARQK